MLVWLIRIVSFNFFRTSVISSSIPMANINRISPNWLRIVMLASDSTGKRNPEASGSKCPSTDGPSTIPATISPMTVGWPIF